MRLVICFLLSLAALAAANPAHGPRRMRRQVQRRAACPTFAEQEYADFQISDGTAGDALAKANAVFVDPFADCDLSTVDDASIEAMQTMREAAEAAETDEFNPAIDAASGAEATTLQNGKIQNKVLKLVGEIQVLNIQSAQGQDKASKIAQEQKKLDNNVALDKKAAGQDSKGVA